jgi:hypothetical protein
MRRVAYCAMRKPQNQREEAAGRRERKKVQSIKEKTMRKTRMKKV